MLDVGELYQSLIEQGFRSDSPRSLAVPFYSSVSGKRFTDAGSLRSGYWRQNLESPVLFYTAVGSLIAGPEKPKLLLEVGPHSALAGPLRQIFKEYAPDIKYASCLQRGMNSTISLLKAIGQLHCNGVKVDLGAMNDGGVTLPDLPTYPWNHERMYWSESRLSREYRSRKFPHHDLLGSRILEGNDLEPTWRVMLQLGNQPWLQDHAIHKDIVFP